MIDRSSEEVMSCKLGLISIWLSLPLLHRQVRTCLNYWRRYEGEANDRLDRR